MNVLALDLGTKCGWAARHQESETGIERVNSGTWILAEPAAIAVCRAEGLDRSREPRFDALYEKVHHAVWQFEIELIAFEDVLFSEYTLQTQLWSTLRAAIWAVCLGNTRLQCRCLNTASLKKYATGNGAATKKMMSAHLLKKYPDLFVKNPKPTENCFLLDKITGRKVDDNETDARHLCDYFSTI